MADFDTPRDFVDPEPPSAPARPQVADEAPEADALEQQTGVLPDDQAAEAEPLEFEFEPELEADLADVAEQRRVVPLSDDDGPLSDE